MNTAFGFIFAALALLAQLPAAIHGVLTDASGALIPGAAVSLSGPEVQKTVQTAADGSYSFQGLAAGDYTLRVSFPDLESFEKRLHIEAGTTSENAIQLRPRVLTQAVTVTEEAGAEIGVEPDKSAGTVVMKPTDLDALPDNPDDLLNILQALAGGAGGQAQIMVDNFSNGQIPPKSAIKEIKINQDPFSAAYDWMGFGRIEIVTKPGGDTLHGAVGLTDSDAAFNSRNPYATNKAGYVNRILTANLGSSFKKRASYTFDFYHNTIDNTALINAVTLDPSTFAALPVQTTVVVPRDDISGTGRLDDQLSPSNTLTGSYRYLRSHRDNNGIGQYSLQSRGYSNRNTLKELHLTETATLNSSAVTTTRLGYTATGAFQNGGISSPSLIVSSAFNGGSAQVGQASHTTGFLEIQSDTTWIHGMHSLKFGGRFHNNPTSDIAPSNFGGTFSFFGVTDAPVLDATNQPIANETAQITSLEQYRRTLLFEKLGYSPDTIRKLGGGASQFSIAGGNPAVNFNFVDLALYGLDDWRVRPNLTVSLGARYRRQNHIHDWKDLGPRAAIAWSPHSGSSTSPKTVIRAGWGAFFDTVSPPVVQQALRFNGTTQNQYVVLNPDFYPIVPPIGSLGSGQASTTYRLDPKLKGAPWMLSAISVDRQLPRNTSISVTYRDQRTTHILQTVDINAPLAFGGVRPYGDAAGNIFQFESGGIQKVKWITLQLNSKFNEKISLTTQYTFMHGFNTDAYTDSGQWSSAIPSNPYNLNQDWGRAGWCNTNNFTLMGTFTAAAGVQLSPLLVAYSGQPYNLTIGSDLNGDTVANDRPAFATDLTRPSVVITKYGSFDTNPMPGQTIVPRNYLTGAPMWNLSVRLSKTFRFPAEAQTSAQSTSPQPRYGLSFNVDMDNVFNHLNPGGFVGNLASPLFGQATAVNLFRDTSNNRRIQFGTQFTF
ncbi:MAG TPA: carboxypeptidase regulatory-like domain-containing protein [Terriglobia bacterium]|jgi:hypothetical protein